MPSVGGVGDVREAGWWGAVISGSRIDVDSISGKIADDDGSLWGGV